MFKKKKVSTFRPTGRKIYEAKKKPAKQSSAGKMHIRANYQDKKWLKREDVAFGNPAYPHFRGYHKSGHPALIVGKKSENEYNFRKVTSSERDGRHLNEIVKPNPERGRTEPMYIGKRVRHDNTDEFTKWHFTWKYKKK